MESSIQESGEGSGADESIRQSMDQVLDFDDGTGQDANKSAVEEISDSEAVNGKKRIVHTYRNCGIQKVFVELPGPVSNRGCGGTGLSSAVITMESGSGKPPPQKKQKPASGGRRLRADEVNEA